jgi:hypothetical protein
MPTIYLPDGEKDLFLNQDFYYCVHLVAAARRMVSTIPNQLHSDGKCHEMEMDSLYYQVKPPVISH